MTERTLKDKVSRLQEIQTEIENLQAEADTLKDRIKEEMQIRAVDELKAGRAVVKWKPITSSRFDQKSFREAHSSLYERCSVPTVARRFTIAT